MSKRAQILFFVLGGFFITNALVAELVGGKIFSLSMPEFVQTLLGWIGIHKESFRISVGVLPWPVVFIATDLVNEFFGKRGVRFYTFTTVGLIAYMFVVLYLARLVPADSISPISQDVFDQVFGLSQGIIVGSITAFAVSQLVDVFIFRKVRALTKGKYLWARATGSTIVSQLIDTFIVGGIAFYLPGHFTFEQYIEVTLVSYTFKVFVALLTTPLCYLGHYLIEWYLGEEEAHRLAEAAAQHSEDA